MTNGPTKGERREAKRHKAQHGMRISGRSTLTVLYVVSLAPIKRKKGRRK